jgi:hypothetical protein
MNQGIIESASTSMATTKETEPEVVAGISSADLNPNQQPAVRNGGAAFGYGRMLMLLAAGLALGYGAARGLRARA